ncbi:MAG: hypothetical protein GX202_07495 [Firmicutes bacterium]|nr:hypothetical protein [Bacillota bacterium]
MLNAYRRKIAINDKWSLSNADFIRVVQGDDSVLLFVKAGYNTDDGTVDLIHGQWEGNNLRFYVEITAKDEAEAVYTTPGGGFTDLFIKQ